MRDESLEQIEFALDPRHAIAQNPDLLVRLPDLLVRLPVLFVHVHGEGVDPAVEPTALMKNQPHNRNAEAENGNADAKNGD